MKNMDKYGSKHQNLRRKNIILKHVSHLAMRRNIGLTTLISLLLHISIVYQKPLSDAELLLDHLSINFEEIPIN